MSSNHESDSANLDALVRRLERASYKLDVVVKAYGDLSEVGVENMGTAVITQEVAAELDGLYCDFDTWIRSHPQDAAAEHSVEQEVRS
jgi:hypothetical protein